MILEYDGNGTNVKMIIKLYHKKLEKKDGRQIRNKAGYTATSCGRVGRGGNARFPIFRLVGYGPMDGRTDGRTKPLIELRVRN